MTSFSDSYPRPRSEKALATRSVAAEPGKVNSIYASVPMRAGSNSGLTSAPR